MKKIPEDMQRFFDARVEGYDAHMADNVEDYWRFYTQIGESIPGTMEHLDVLDLGAGTGIELDYIFSQAPNVRITAVDLSEAMLGNLRRKYAARKAQIRTITGSYLAMELAPRTYDIVVSVMSLHHLLPQQKTALYKKIRRALVPAGLYIEGDYIVSAEEELRLIANLKQLKREHGLNEDALYHIDIPFSEGTQRQCLEAAGFNRISVRFRSAHATVIVARTEREARLSSPREQNIARSPTATSSSQR